MQCDFRLAIVKGLTEHGNGNVYFGSLGGYLAHYEQAEKAGWVSRHDRDQSEILTLAGREIYDACRLSTLPTTLGSRAYLWDWSNIPELTSGPGTEGTDGES